MAPTRLDDETEKHDGPEPKVLVVDVQAILRGKVRPGEDGEGESVRMIADRAEVSTRTVYRALNPKMKDPDNPEGPPIPVPPGNTTVGIGLDLADRLCLRADAHLSHCRLLMADGSVVPY